MSEIIRRWQSPCRRFRLVLIDEYKSHHGRRMLSYRFYSKMEGSGDKYRGVFRGDDFGPSPLHADDSNENVAALLSFLSLRPRDMERDYFDDYTPRQIEWRDMFAEELGYIAYEMKQTA